MTQVLFNGDQEDNFHARRAVAVGSRLFVGWSVVRAGVRLMPVGRVGGGASWAGGHVCGEGRGLWPGAAMLVVWGVFIQWAGVRVVCGGITLFVVRADVLVGGSSLGLALCRLWLRVVRPLDLALPQGWQAGASRRHSVAPPFSVVLSRWTFDMFIIL